MSSDNKDRDPKSKAPCDLDERYKPLGIQAVNATSTCRYWSHAPKPKGRGDHAAPSASHEADRDVR